MTISHNDTARRERAWTLYDWANSAFATVIMAGFFPVFFKQWWNEGVPEEVSTLRLALFSSGAAANIINLTPFRALYIFHGICGAF